MACAEPDRLRAAVLLWRNARPAHGAGAHHLCAAAEQAAGRVERRRGRALPGGNPEPQKPHRADHGLCRRTARVDEMRVGEKNKLTYRWARKGSRPRAAHRSTMSAERDNLRPPKTWSATAPKMFV